MIWIATDAASPGDIVVRVSGGRCSIALRKRQTHGYYFVGGVRPLIAGVQEPGGNQAGAIRISFREYDGYFNIYNVPLEEENLHTSFEIF